MSAIQKTNAVVFIYLAKALYWLGVFDFSFSLFGVTVDSKRE